MAEWSKAHAWNACRRGTVSWVRIPPPPPFLARAPEGAPHGRRSRRVALLPGPSGMDEQGEALPSSHH